MTEASFSFKQTETPFIGSVYPIKEPKLTKVQQAILALKPETDQCIEMGEFLSDSEITSLVVPIKRELIRIHGTWTDEFHLNRRRTKRAMEHNPSQYPSQYGNKWNPVYAKYTVVRQSFEKRYEGGAGSKYKCRFYVRYSRFYADALARGEVIKPKAKEK